MPDKMTVKLVCLFLAGALVAAGLVAIVFLVMQLQGAKGEAQQAQASGTMTEAAVDAGYAASGTVDALNTARETRVVIQMENRDAILASPGADQDLDPAFLDVLCSGMRRYASGRHACDQVQPVDPAVVADAGSGGGDR